MASIGILGAGTWGIALTRMLSLSGHDVQVWSAVQGEIDDLKKTRKHKNLPHVNIPDSVDFTKEIATACLNKDIIVFAVPSIYVNSTAQNAADYINKHQIVVNVAKGIDVNTLKTMSEIIYDELDVREVAVLSGPTHAEEVAIDLPTTIVLGCDDVATASKLQAVFENTNMKVYISNDKKGVELCGALKNIVALAAGISDGLGFGDNAKAALITKGILEIGKLGEKIGCKKETFYDLAGIGDLIVTATSRHSRNNRCGYYIGKGYSAEDASRKVGMVVEGINVLPAAIELSKMYKVAMPIFDAVNQIVTYQGDPMKIARQLMK